jgi:hypothetical protein
MKTPAESCEGAIGSETQSPNADQKRHGYRGCSVLASEIAAIKADADTGSDTGSDTNSDLNIRTLQLSSVIERA